MSTLPSYVKGAREVGMPTLVPILLYDFIAVAYKGFWEPEGPLCQEERASSAVTGNDQRGLFIWGNLAQLGFPKRTKSIDLASKIQKVNLRFQALQLYGE